MAKPVRIPRKGLQTTVARVAVTPSLSFVFMQLVNGLVSAVKRRYHRHCDPNLELGGGPGKGGAHVMPRCLHQETNWRCGRWGRVGLAGLAMGGGGDAAGTMLRVTNK